VRRLGYVAADGDAAFEAKLADETQLVHATFEAPVPRRRRGAPA
jgi:hypothetical protein